MRIIVRASPGAMTRVVALAALLISAPAAMADGWGSIGTGAVHIGAPDTGGGEDGFRGAGHLALTFAGRTAVRLRATAFGYGGNSAVEQAALVGLRVGQQRDGILLIGYSKLDDVSQTEDNTNGASLELLYAPQHRGIVSYEVSLHGNVNDDHGFAGLLVAARFGSMGEQPSRKPQRQ